jgi:bacterioferritin-associated ferredoxin
MFVCLCFAVSDKHIKKLIETGAKSVRQIQDHCKAGTNCGTCINQLKAEMKAHQDIALCNSPAGCGDVNNENSLPIDHWTNAISCLQ